MLKIERKQKVRNLITDLLNIIVHTSNVCERLFSCAKLLLSSLRKNLFPSTLNMLVFLKANRWIWTDPMIIQNIVDSKNDNDSDDSSSDSDSENEDDVEDNDFNDESKKEN